jgi:ATP-dependent RNA helicase RhlB
LSHRVLELAYEHMNEATKLTVETDNVTADRVRQIVYFPATEEKLPLLIGLLSRMDAHRSIIFVNMKIAAEKVARRLERQGFLIGMLSGDVPQKKRQSLLGKFQRGEIEILIATDVAARGLHVDNVSHVFNYDLPQDAEDYVHRIGRTARLGADGDAISFACDMYAQGLPDIEAYIGQKIPTAAIDPELLIAPPLRPRSTAPVVEEEDDGSIPTRGPPPKGDRNKGRRDGQRSSSAPRPARPRSETPKVEAPKSEAPKTAAPNGATPSSAPRRSRGGRGRGRRAEGGEQSSPRTENVAHNKPTRESTRPRAAQASQSTRAAVEKPAPAAAKKKPGFFKRLVGTLLRRS